MDSKVEDLLEHYYQKFRDIPEDLHLLCPKVDDDDDEDYDDLNNKGEGISIEEKKKRVQDGEERLDITYWTSLLMAYGKDKTGIWLETWGDRIALNLHLCDQCVANWHKNRKTYLKRFAEHWDDAIAASIKDILHRFDFVRLDKGLGWANEQIDLVEREGRQFTKQDLGNEQGAVLIALYEALCCMAYLSIPEKRACFQKVFERCSSKKPLKLGDNVLLPAMTYFLFEEDPTRLRFATKSYERIPPESVSMEHFNWAIRDDLAPVMQKASTWDPSNDQLHSEVERFWRGIIYVLNTLDGEVMLRGMRSLEVKPNLCDLLFSHIHFKSEAILLYTLEALSIILRRAPKLIRDTIMDARPFVVVEQVFFTPLIRRLLAQSVTFAIPCAEDSTDITCPTINWINWWVRSVGLHEKSDACEQLLHLLFTKEIKNGNLGEEGNAACIRAGLDALEHVLQSFMEPTVNLTSGSTSVYVNSILNVILRHKDIINDAFNDNNQLSYSLGVQNSASKVIKSALQLDTRIMAAEHRELRRQDANADSMKGSSVTLQTTVQRDSPALWESFLSNMSFDNRRLAHHMVTAMGPIISLDRFRPKRKSPDSLDPTRKRLSDQLGKTAVVCGRVLSRLCDFRKDDLYELWVHDNLSRIILAFTVHSEEDLRDASREVVKAMTDEISHSDALRVELSQRLETTLVSLNYGILQIASAPSLAWGFAEPVISTSRYILDSLCDETSGVLRSRTLQPGEEAALSTWWTAQWKYIERAFSTTSYWTSQVEVEVMKNFCRSTIELADSLMGQVGLIASALQRKQQRQPMNDALSSTPPGMHNLLKEPKERLFPIVNMVRLRDAHLVGTTVKVVANLLKRLRESEHEIPSESRQFIRGVCIKRADGRYDVPSNTQAQEKAELLKALGEDEDEPTVVSIRPAPSKKKQSTIDAWSKSGTSGSGSSTSTRTNKDDVLELSSSVDKHKTILDKITAKQTATPKAPLPPKPKVDPAVANRGLLESRKLAAAEKKKRDAAAIAAAKALRGPEVKGVSGAVDKDHVPQKNEIMVESDEEESEDSGDSDTERLISKGKQGQKAVDEATRRRERALLEKTRGPVKKTRVVRSAKDMRARLIPPMDQLHQAILEWDIFHEGNDPPNLQDCARVSDTYSNPDQYKQTFWKLLISEAWRSFVTSKDESTAKKFGIKIASRMNVDRFLEITASLPIAENKDRFLSEGDIILLSKSPNPLNDPNEPHALARIWKTAFKRDLLEVTYRLNTKNNPLQSSLQISSELNAVKITNMTTIEREYAALESLKYYDLMDEVLKAEPSPVLKYGDQAVNNVMKNYELNPGQAKAILGAKDNDGFTLIQGPPGTGKTKTIVAMVGALMTGNIPQAGGVALANIQNNHNRNGANKKKILVCAPSNAAVDELVLRLKQGVKTMPSSDSKAGSLHNLKVLRLGRSDAINAAVRDVTLDELVKARMEGDQTKATMMADRDKLHGEAANIKTQVEDLRQKLMAFTGNRSDPEYVQMSRKFDELKSKQRRVGHQIDAQKESGNTISREIEIKRKKIQQEILDGAQVLCATLSGSGHEMFKNLSVDFETVIIDEAAQCVELSALIPLKYGCTKCILVGDPKQLPPTVLSQSAAKFGYDQSLFVRMQRNHPDYIHMLDRQYRMHPEISMFPSHEFYEGKLVDGDKMGELRKQLWHSSPLLGPYRFFDVEGTQERGRKGQSLVNMEELQVAKQLYRRFRDDYGKHTDIKGKIGIITPYKAQLYELRSQFAIEYGERVTEDIEFNTTDAFQGRECEIIIFSCVRASPTGGIGFMQDIRRMNVGLTRAKSSLWILGDSRALIQGQFWAKLIENAKRRNLYTNGNIMKMLRQASHTTRPKLSQANSEQDVIMNDPSRISTARTAAEWDMQHRTARINVRGEMVPTKPPLEQVPTIQTSMARPAGTADARKRPRDGDGDAGQHSAKRIHSDGNRGSPVQVPTGPRSMMRPPQSQREKGKERDPKPSQDPSAMEALGLIPPTRPPPPAAEGQAYNGTKSGGTGPGPGPPGPAAKTTTGLNRVNEIQQRSRQQNSGASLPPKKKKGGDPFLNQRRPKRQ